MPLTESTNTWPKLIDSLSLSAAFKNFLCNESLSLLKSPKTRTSFDLAKCDSNFSVLSNDFDAGPTCDLIYLTMPSASRGPLYSDENSPPVI